MDIIVDRGAGLDVHKETVVATIDGSGIKRETRTFRTFTGDLEQLRSWLKANGITHVAMECAGIYWKPVFNILEEDFEVVLVNARHIKHVPGRKTDVCDSEWLCKLLRSGLVKGSFIPLLLVVATPEMKLTGPVLSTRECCHEHAGEIFHRKPAIHNERSSIESAQAGCVTRGGLYGMKAKKTPRRITEAHILARPYRVRIFR